MKIKAHNISYKYESSSKNAISNIDLEITQGEKVVIIGANGCGKTTLLKVLCGLYKPTQGDIMIEGRAVKPSPSFNFLVGLVPENPAEMFFEESVEREVNFILKRKKVDKETQKVTVDNTLTQFGLLKLKIEHHLN